jgi:uncharacterized Ntn-hydrolase superfamily protein
MSRVSLLVLAGILCLGGMHLPAGSPRPRGEAATPAPKGDHTATFSIVAYDPEAREWGVAVASKYLAVGSVVPWARAGVGAIATQAYVNVNYGRDGLELLKKGKSAQETLDTLTAADRGRDYRQVGIVDAHGKVASFTGKKCNAWAGSKTGKNYTCQGNILASEKVVEAMARAFEKSSGKPLAWRLMSALEAGEKAGGDKRGKQSAALLVVREGAGPNRIGDRYLDFRVDDHKDPIPELARILNLRLPRR